MRKLKGKASVLFDRVGALWLALSVCGFIFGSGGWEALIIANIWLAGSYIEG